jgi:hypothetical protein
MNKINLFSIIFCVGLGVGAHGDTEQWNIPLTGRYLIGVDLRDQIHFHTPYESIAQAIANDMVTQPANYFPEQVTFTLKGPGFAPDSRKNAVYGVEFIEPPKVKNNRAVFKFSVVYDSPQDGLHVRVLEAGLQKDGEKIRVLKVVTDNDVLAKTLHFDFHVGLMQRKAILTESTLGLKKVYPIAASGFDETRAKARFLVPLYQNAHFDPRYVIPMRTDPDYYGGRPFIRVTEQSGTYTPIGFHYSITSQLQRGFMSHGCIRMRDRDLYELFALVMEHHDDFVQVQMQYYLKDEGDSPYPLQDKFYSRFKNFGTEQNPQILRDEDGLVIMETVPGPPPIEQFKESPSEIFLSER